MTPRQVLWKVEIRSPSGSCSPGSAPARCTVVATATLAALAGVAASAMSSSTRPATDGRRDRGALCVTALAFLVEGVFAGIQRLLTPKALRYERSRPT